MLVKLAINSVINPLTAVIGAGGIPNGALIGTIPAFRLIRALSKETANVLTAYLHSLSHPHPPPPDVLRLFSHDVIAKSVTGICRSTAQNQSSMAFDIVARKPTEIRYITGYLINLAKKLGVETPRHEMLYDMVEFTGNVSGLEKTMPISTSEGVQNRRRVIRDLTTSSPKSPQEIELAQRALDVQENKAINDREKIIEMRAARRSAKHTDYYDAIEDDMAGLAPSRREWGLYNRRDRDRLMSLKDEDPENVLRALLSIKSVGARLHRERLLENYPELARAEKVETNHGDAPRSKSVNPAKGVESSQKERVSSPQQPTSATTPESSPSAPPKPKASGSWMDSMIASAPRIERTWDVPVAPPRARGPVPKKEEKSQSLAAAPAKPKPEDVSKGISTQQPSTKPHNDQKHNNQTSTSSDNISDPYTQPNPDPQQPTKFASKLDALISGAPRQERTWEDRKDIPKQDGGKYMTSRSSGS